MAAETFESLYNKVIGHCPLAPAPLARTWVMNAFRDLMEKRHWSWRIKRGTFVSTTAYNTGTVTATTGSPIIVGQGTTFTSAMVGQQIRVNGTATGIYTITAFTSATQITIDQNWPLTTATTVVYEIYQVYFPAATDLQSLLSVVSPNNLWRLNIHVHAAELDGIDPIRIYAADPRMVASAQYNSVTNRPTFELWPHIKTAQIYPYLYLSRYGDVSDSTTVSIPYAIPGQVLLAGAMKYCCMWPGPDLSKRNPYFQGHLLETYDREWKMGVMELEREDNEIYEADTIYDEWPNAPALNGYGGIGSGLTQKYY